MRECAGSSRALAARLAVSRVSAVSTPVPPTPPPDERARPLSRSGAHELALRDDLTGVFNRRYLRQLFESEWSELLERHGQITLLLLDLDRFKEVNDRYGHLAGDEVLCRAAARLRGGFRDGDRLVRYGGDEFVVVLPGAGIEEARALAERARTAVLGEDWIDPATGQPIDVPVSFSVGIAAAPLDGRSGEDVLAIADRQLYAEKRDRRAALEAADAGPASRGAWITVLAAVVAAAATVLGIWWLAGGASAPALLDPAPAVEAARRAREAAREREGELVLLREEVDRLRAALVRELPDEERARYEARIQELERTMARARPDAAAAAAPAPSVASAQPAPPGPTPAAALPEPRASPSEPRALAGERVAAPDAGSPSPPRAPVIVPPQLVEHRPPVYPVIARLRGLEARIEFRVTVDALGRIVRLEPVGERAGFGFDEAARTAALSATYRPGSRDGEPREMETTLRIEFRIGR